MKYKKFGHQYVLRIDEGEEVLRALKYFCAKQGIRSGSLTGIGATRKAVISFFDAPSKKFYSKELSGNFEIVSLTGNISKMADDPYIHCHITLGDENFVSWSGHLNLAIISTTCEIVIDVIDGEVARKFSKEIGLNLLDL